MRFWKIGLGFMVVIFLAVVFWCAYFFNLGLFAKALWEIYRLQNDSRNTALEKLFIKKNDYYSGIIAKIEDGKDNGLWVWGAAGLRFFSIDEFSAYFYANGCRDKIVKANSEDANKIKINEFIAGFGFDGWKGDIGVPGDYIVIHITGESMGGKLGNAREIHVYNWWPFLPIPMNKSCAK